MLVCMLNECCIQAKNRNREFVELEPESSDSKLSERPAANIERATVKKEKIDHRNDENMIPFYF